MFYKLLIIFLFNFMIVLSKSERELSKYGIRENTLNEYNNKYNTNYQIETLTKNQAIEISAELVKKYHINEIKENYLKLIIFDTIFNTGYFSGSSILQKSLNRYYGTTVKVDGIIGSKTINLLNKVEDTERFSQIFLKERLTYYKKLKE